MRTVRKEKPISPASCEKNTLFRHAIRLPKIAHSYTSRSSVDQSISLLTPIPAPFPYRRRNKAPNSPAHR
jgi:hypothetical protein